MNKTLIFYIFMFLHCGVSGSIQKHDIFIENIEGDLLAGYLLIYIEINNKPSMLISELQSDIREDINCIDSIKVGELYSVELEKLYAFPLKDGLTFRLYTNDLYIDEKLIFPKDLKVFTSKNIIGYCLIK